MPSYTLQNEYEQYLQKASTFLARKTGKKVRKVQILRAILEIAMEDWDKTHIEAEPIITTHRKEINPPMFRPAISKEELVSKVLAHYPEQNKA